MINKLAEQTSYRDGDLSSSPVLFTRRRRRLLLAAILLSLAWFSPWLAGMSPLRNWIAQQALGDIDGKLEVGGASLGWLSPIRLRNVRLKNPADQTLLEVEQIATKRALLALLFHPNRPGDIQVESPTVYFEGDERHHNWKALLASIPVASDSQESFQDLVIRVSNGAIQFRSKGDQNWSGYRVPNLEIEMPADEAALRLSGRLLSSSKQNDSAAAKESIFMIESTSSDDAASAWNCLVDADELELGKVQPLLAYLIPGVAVRGTLHGQLEATWRSDVSQWELDCEEVVLYQPALALPVFSNNESLTVDTIQIRGQLSGTHEQLMAKACELKCELGEFSANGSLSFRDLWEAPLDIDRYQDFSLSGDLDLGALATQLPDTLGVREQLSELAGELTLVSFSRLEGRQRRVFVDLRAGGLSAANGNRRFALEGPIQASLSARMTDQGPSLEFVQIESEFLRCEGEGSLESGRVDAFLNLEKLSSQLGQFVDLRSLSIKGTATGNLNWEPKVAATAVIPASVRPDADHYSVDVADHPVHLNAVLDMIDLHLGADQTTWLSEPHLTLTADGDLNSLGPKWSIAETTVSLSAGNDLVTVNSPLPFDSDSADPHRLQISVEGELQSLLARFERQLPEWLLGSQGRLSLAGSIEVNSQGAKLTSAPYRIINLNASIPGMQIKEPDLQGTLNLELDFEESDFEFSDTTAVGNTISVVATNMVYDFGSADQSFRGDVAFRADAYRLSEWMDSLREVAYRPFGELAGNGTIAMNGEEISLEFNAVVDQFAVGERAEPTNANSDWIAIWTDDRLGLQLAAAYTWDQERVQIPRFALRSPALALSGNGFVARPWADCYVSLTGQMETELEQLSTKMNYWTNDMVRFAGSSNESFEFKGRLGSVDEDGRPIAQTPAREGDAPQGLVPKTISSRSAIRFESANLLGVETGASLVQGQLSNQVLRFDPIDLPIGDGRLRAEPTIRLSGNRPILVVNDQQLLERVRLDSKVTAGWIGYAAPLLAQTADTDGIFSVRMDRANIPLTDVFAGTANGMIEVHQARLGPGPLTGQLIQIARQVRGLIGRQSDGGNGDRENWALMPTQQIQFQLVEGRVYHDQVVVQIDDLLLATSGSIGADQSLQLILAFNVPASWVEDRPLARALANTTVRLPIRGTLESPEIDQQAWQQLSTDLLRGAAGNLLDDELRRGLRDLFKDR